MAKSLRARKNKVQRAVLRSSVFRPVEQARNVRLFEKTMERHESLKRGAQELSLAQQQSSIASTTLSSR